MEAFTGIKDADLLILSELNDRDLLNVCLIKNKYVDYICKTESFWRNRFVAKYGETAAKYKPEDRSWRNHYMKVIVDLNKFSKPTDIFSYILWGSKGIENSFYNKEPIYVYFDRKEWIPLSKAPEWVMNNLWLSNLGNTIKLRSIIGGNIETIEIKETNLTPIKVLKKVSETIFKNPVYKDFLINLFFINNTNKEDLAIRLVNKK